MKYTRYLGVFLLLFTALGFSTAAAAPGVAAGETYTWLFSVSLSDGESTEATMGRITIEITSVEGSVISGTIMSQAQDNSTLAQSIITYYNGDYTIDVSQIESLVDDLYFFIDTEAATKSYENTVEVFGVTMSSNIVYNEQGILETYETIVSVSDSVMTTSINLQTGGTSIAGFPTLALGAATLLGLVFVVLKKKN